jgi:ankyrin repeat protein
MKSPCLAVALILMCLLGPVALADGPTQSLFAAIRHGNAAEVQRCLSEGASVNGREVVAVKPRIDDRSGRTKALGDTPLMAAAQSGRIALVKLLLAHGANVNGTGECGYTALMEAVRRPDREIARLLLERGAKPNVQNENGDTAIVFAANEGDVALVAALLDHGADINGGTGWTPLMEAAYCGYPDVVRLLLKRGAPVNLQQGNSMTPLECALAQSDADMAALLRKAGGRKRPAAALQRESVQLRETERADAAQRQADARRFSKERILTPEDQGVMEAALRDLRTYQGAAGFTADPARPDIALVDVTDSGTGMISDDQLNGELDDSQASDITREIRVQLQQRNGASTPLTGLGPHDPHIVLVDEKSTGWMARFQETHPHVRAWVQIYLPAYSPQHDAVVLRFEAGPSAHGMSGTYFLVRSDGRWRVKWRHFASYA